MQSSALFWVGITTLLLITVTVMVAMDFPFNWVFYLTVLGQILIVCMIYKVLTENYRTEKSFEDFYEDCPISERLQQK